MGTVNRKMMTPYEAIPVHTKHLKIYSIKNIYSVGTLIDGLRSWNLHGSANSLEIWASRMHDYHDSEWDATPLGVMDWQEMDDAWALMSP